ncbi:MAG: methyltransferase regulatory domain-containing protein [Rhizobiales bacterium]|nr:methyltransferase regulatory domain-containing protein [Hyphomicrobiales bacterium]
MTETAPFAYDAVFYPGVAFEQTHPDRLATIGTLFGMQPAPPARCRVLELGCGVGANLIPMGAQFPQSTFVGIDLSAPTIAQGREQVAALGLSNVELVAGDIMQVDAAFGQFDYIIAHGVYSWVPQFVRDKIFAVYRECLAPQGIGFVSYNARPGSHLRDLGRRMMQFHTRQIADPNAQVRQSRALIKFLAETGNPDTVYGAALREIQTRVAEKTDEVLYHDDLDANARPFLFHEVAEAAEREGLQYLSESPIARSIFGAIPAFSRALVEQVPAEQVVVREQYLDLLIGRWFRETLFCRADVPLRREINVQTVSGLSVAGDFHADEAAPPLATHASATFRSEAGDALEVEEPLIKAALGVLGAAWPRAIAFPELVRTAAARLAAEGGGGPPPVRDVERLAATLLRAYTAGSAHLHVEPPRLAERAGERPVASLLARRLAAASPVVTTLRHATIRLDGVLHPFPLLVDGTRTVVDLAPHLERLLAAHAAANPDEAAPHVPAASNAEAQDRVAQALASLARLGLLTE